MKPLSHKPRLVMKGLIKINIGTEVKQRLENLNCSRFPNPYKFGVVIDRLKIKKDLDDLFMQQKFPYLSDLVEDRSQAEATNKLIEAGFSTPAAIKLIDGLVYSRQSKDTELA